MGQRIKMRADTAANWTSINPVLQNGEFGYVTNQKYFKIGDGVTTWNSLLKSTAGKDNTAQFGTIAINSGSNAPHNLGASPKILESYLICITASNGYAVGEKVYDLSAKNYWVSVDATTIYIRFGTALPQIFPKLGGAAVAITAANWRVEVYTN